MRNNPVRDVQILRNPGINKQMRASDYSGVTTGSPTVTISAGLVTLKYTGSGTYVHS